MKDFIKSPTVNGEDFIVPIVDLADLEEGEKYYFKIQVRGLGDIVNDHFNDIGYLTSTTFSKDDIGNSLGKNEPPQVSITTPKNNSSFEENQNITFSCDATDKEDGEISSENISWYSNIDGLMGKGKTIEYSLLAIGDHTISVKVIDSAGEKTQDEIQLSITKTTGKSPEVLFSASITNINVGESIQFTDQSKNEPTSWSWDFGDGGTSVQQNPSHSYISAGSYTVSLTASNIHGSDTEVKTNYIEVTILGSEPVANFTASKTNIMEGDAVQFTDQSTNNPTSWSWDFGDGSSSILQNPSHTYSTEGTYTVSLTVSNSYGSDVETKSNYITVSESSGGDDIVFNPNLTYGTMNDIDGNTYKTIQIGSQTWMAENLKTTYYADGTAIPHVASKFAWDNLDYTDKAYCWYDNNSSNGEIYGALYTWAAATNGAGSSGANPSGIQGVCPSGWHLPSDEEWKQLEIYLGMSQSQADGTSWRGTDEGGKLKETGTTHWKSLNYGATNESGFTALPGGGRYHGGSFSNVGSYAYFWTATGRSGSYAWRRVLHSDYAEVYRYYSYKYYGFSVRCVGN